MKYSSVILYLQAESRLKNVSKSNLFVCVPEDRSESAVTFGDARHDQN